MRFRPVFPVVVVGLLLAGCAPDPDDSPAATSEPATTTATTTAEEEEEPEVAAPGFLFGFLAPGAGLLDEIAIAQERALTLAVDDINGAGGLLDAPVGSTVVDEPPGGTVEEAIDQLIEQGAGVVLGPVGSDSALAALPVLAERDMVGCSASATLSTLTDGSNPSSFIRTALADDLLVGFAADELAAVAQPLATGEPFSVRVVARGDDYGYAVGNGLASELLARGFDVTVQHYHPRTVIFGAEVAEVVAADPDLVVVVAYEEGPLLLGGLVEAGFPAARLAGLDGLFVPRIAEQALPAAPQRLDGLTVLGTTGDRAFMDRLLAAPGQQQVVYGAQLYDCAIVVALAVAASGSTDPLVFGPRLREVTEGGRTCSSYRDCVALVQAGEDIDYDGVSGRLALDERGDVTDVRFTIAAVEGGQLVEVRSVDVDFLERQRDAAFQAAMLTTRIQQVLKALGYYDGEINGILDDATVAAIAALQADLGLEPTGQFDEATDAALRERFGAAAGALGLAVADLQQALMDLGFFAGPVDGRYTAATADAIRAAQRELGVPETGVLDVATLQAIYARGAAGATPPPTEPPSPEPPATEPPTTGPSPTQPPATAAPSPGTPAPTPPSQAPDAGGPAPPNATQPTSTTTTASPTTTKPPDPPADDEPDLFEVLAADQQFSELVELLLREGFDDDLRQLDVLTLFAPTNTAIDALPPDVLGRLEDPVQLEALLAHHVVPGEFTSSELEPGDVLITTRGDSLTVGPGPTVDGVTISAADLIASNGVVHAIDAVLIPPPS